MEGDGGGWLVDAGIGEGMYAMRKGKEEMK